MALYDIPKPDRFFYAATGNGTSVGGKGQTKHPVGMPFNGLHTPGRCCLLDLPQSNRSRKVATGKQASIGAPGEPIHRTRVWQDLEVGAAVGIPELDRRITPTTGKQPAIR